MDPNLQVPRYSIAQRAPYLSNSAQVVPVRSLLDQLTIPMHRVWLAPLKFLVAVPHLNQLAGSQSEASHQVLVTVAALGTVTQTVVGEPFSDVRGMRPLWHACSAAAVKHELNKIDPITIARIDISLLLHTINVNGDIGPLQTTFPP